MHYNTINHLLSFLPQVPAPCRSSVASVFAALWVGAASTEPPASSYLTASRTSFSSNEWPLPFSIAFKRCLGITRLSVTTPTCIQTMVLLTTCIYGMISHMHTMSHLILPKSFGHLWAEMDQTLYFFYYFYDSFFALISVVMPRESVKKHWSGNFDITSRNINSLSEIAGVQCRQKAFFPFWCWAQF